MVLAGAAVSVSLPPRNTERYGALPRHHADPRRGGSCARACAVRTRGTGPERRCRRGLGDLERRAGLNVDLAKALGLRRRPHDGSVDGRRDLPAARPGRTAPARVALRRDARNDPGGLDLQRERARDTQRSIRAGTVRRIRAECRSRPAGGSVVHRRQRAELRHVLAASVRLRRRRRGGAGVLQLLAETYDAIKAIASGRDRLGCGARLAGESTTRAPARARHTPRRPSSAISVAPIARAAGRRRLMDVFDLHVYGDTSAIPPSMPHSGSTTITEGDYGKLVDAARQGVRRHRPARIDATDLLRRVRRPVARSRLRSPGLTAEPRPRSPSTRRRRGATMGRRSGSPSASRT